MKSGLQLTSDVPDDQEHTKLCVIACLRLFTVDSLNTAANYCDGQHRNEINADDMKRCMMFQARTFFQQDDDVVTRRIEAELVRMNEEESSEGEEGDEGDDDEANEGDDEANEGDDEANEGDDEEAEYRGREYPELTNDAKMRLIKNVNLVHENWHSWTPENLLHIAIKRSIDAISVG